MSLTTILAVFAITLALLALGMLAMSVGVIGSGRCLRGSCGGSDVHGADGESLACVTCPNRNRKSPASAPHSE